MSGLAGATPGKAQADAKTAKRLDPKLEVPDFSSVCRASSLFSTDADAFAQNDPIRPTRAACRAGFRRSERPRLAQQFGPQLFPWPFVGHPRHNDTHGPGPGNAAQPSVKDGGRDDRVLSPDYMHLRGVPCCRSGIHGVERLALGRIVVVRGPEFVVQVARHGGQEHGVNAALTCPQKLYHSLC